MSKNQDDNQAAETEIQNVSGKTGPIAPVGQLGEADQELVTSITSGSLQQHVPSGPIQEFSSRDTSAMEFRVVRPGAPVRRLRLTGKRYTFGSGEGCSIQLDDDSLRPMHAVLLRDAHKILIRAYSVPLEHNGERVTESSLRVGDIIRMGTYRFELLSAPLLERTPRPGARGRTSFGAMSTGFAAEQFPYHDQFADLSQQLHARQAECEIRETRCDQRESELHDRESELWTRAETLQRRENRLVEQEAAAREIQSSYSASQEEFVALRKREAEANELLRQKEAELLTKSEELQERQAELEKRQREWQTRETQYAERAAEAQRDLEEAQQQAQSATGAVGRMREEFATLNEQLTQLRERHAELQDRERGEQAEHERLRAELETAHDEALDARTHSESKLGETEQQLQQVTSDLEATRRELEEVRGESQARQEELREKLRLTSEEFQTAREQAETARREWEQEQAYSENKIGELQSRIDAFEKNQIESDSQSEETISQLMREREAAEHGRKQAEEARQEAETVAEELRLNIDQLQDDVSQARQEAERLRADFDGAQASVQQLELLVDHTKKSSESDQSGWIEESQQLRETIEQLSSELAAANDELAKLRSSNEALTNELSDQPAVDTDQFQAVQEELDSARRQIEQLEQTHAETVARMESERQESESALRDEIDQLREEIAAAQRSAEASIRQAAQPEAAQPEAAQPEAAEASQTEPEQAEPEQVEPEAIESTPADWGQYKTENSDPALVRSDEDEADVADGDIPAASHDAEDGSDEDAYDVSESVPMMAIEESMDLQDLIHSRADIQRDLSKPGRLFEEEDADVQDLADQAEQEDEECGNVLRMESEQSVEENSHLSSWGSEEDEDDGESDHLTHTHMFSAEDDDEEDKPVQQYSWHDEPPEQSVGDAIDDIQHNVEQAMVDPQVDDDLSAWHAGETDESEEFDEEPLDDDAEHTIRQSTSPVSATDLVREFATRDETETDTPLNWSAFLPNGKFETAEPSESVEDEQEFDDEEDPEDPAAYHDYSRTAVFHGHPDSGVEPGTGWDDQADAGADAHSANVNDPEDSQWGQISSGQDAAAETNGEEVDVDPTSESSFHAPEVDAPPPANATQIWEGSVDSAGTQNEPELEETPLAPADSEEPSAGSLAEMLIRNLEEQERDSDVAPESSDHGLVVDAADEFDDASGIAGDADQESSDWNYDSPDLDEDRSDDQDSYGYDSTPVDEATDSSSTDSEILVERTDSYDQSIEDYIGRLIQRVQGNKGSDSADVPTKQPGEPEPVEEEAPMSVVERLAEQAQQPIVPRSHAPERTKDLSAMRDLANQSARNAVARSIRVQARDTQMKAMLKSSVAVLFLVLAVGVVLFVTLSMTIKIAMAGAFVVLSGVFGQEAYVLMRDARRRFALADEGTTEPFAGQVDLADLPPEAEALLASGELAGSNSAASDPANHDADVAEPAVDVDASEDEKPQA